MLRVLFFLILVLLETIEGNYQLLTAVTGEVHKENFTYYSLTYDGTLLLELTSITGDCDLYVSQNTIRPTYEPQNNCLQSATCGLDSVIIPKSFKRPLGLGIFGYPSHEISQYILTVSRVDDSLDRNDFVPINESFQSQYLNRKIEKTGMEDHRPDEEGEESVYWVLLRSLFKFLIEIFINL